MTDRVEKIESLLKEAQRYRAPSTRPTAVMRGRPNPPRKAPARTIPDLVPASPKATPATNPVSAIPDLAPTPTAKPGFKERGAQLAKARSELARKKFKEMKGRILDKVQNAKNRAGNSLVELHAQIQMLRIDPLMSPLARKGIGVAAALVVLYLASGGKSKPAATNPSLKAISDLATQQLPVGKGSLQTSIVLIGQCKEAVENLPQASGAVQVLDLLLKSIVPVVNYNMNLDDPASVQAFTTLCQSAEAAITSFFEKSASMDQIFSQTTAAKQFAQLQAELGEFLLDIDSTRNALSAPEPQVSNQNIPAEVQAGDDKYDILIKHAEMYEYRVKEAAFTAGAALGIYFGIAFVNSYLRQWKNSAVQAEQIKQHLQRLVDFVDMQEKSGKGFGEHATIFVNFRDNAKIVIQLLDKMIKGPQHQQDTSQIDASRKFVSSGSEVINLSQDVLGALDELQTWTSNIGGVIHGIGLDFGINWNRYQAFKQHLDNIYQPLNLLIRNVSDALTNAEAEAKKAAEAQQAANVTSVPATNNLPAEQISNITI